MIARGHTRRMRIPVLFLGLLGSVLMLLSPSGPAAHSHAPNAARPFLAAAQPTITSLYVSPSGTDDPSCGSSIITACASIRQALALVPATGATVWLDDGVYRGSNNSGLVLGQTSLRLASLSGNPAAVVLDNEEVLQRRHFQINTTLGALNGISAADRSSIEGITFRGGRGASGGSIQIIGSASISAVHSWSIINCIFEENQALPTSSSLFGGAIIVSNVALAGSKASVIAEADKHNFFAPDKPVATTAVATLPRAYVGGPPLSPYSHANWTSTPPEPTTFDPAVFIRNCVFRNNSFVKPVPYTGLAAVVAVLAGSSLVVERSYTLVEDSLFTEHNWPALYTVQLGGGSGASWIRRCTWRDNSIAALAGNLLDTLATTLTDGHHLLISDSVFERNEAAQAQLDIVTAIIGAWAGHVLSAFGVGEVTLVNVTVRDSIGPSFSIGSFASVRVYDSTFARLSSPTLPSILFIYASTGVQFVRTSFISMTSVSGPLLGGLSKDVLISYFDCDFEENVASASGGVFDLNFATSESFVWVVNSRFKGNEAANGGVLTQASTKAGFLAYNCSFDGNNAMRTGGVANVAAGETWFIGCNFTDNTAPSGGVIGALSGATFHVINSQLIGNRAYEGGALWSQQGSLGEVRSSLLEANEAKNYGGASYDGTYLAYINSTFRLNRAALSGGALFFEAVTAPLVELLPGLANDAETGTLARDCTNMFFEGNASTVEFDRNDAGVYGGGLFFDGPVLACSSFCTPNSLTAEQAQASTSDVWVTSRCRFSHNTAGAGYGANFASALDHVGLVANMSGSAAGAASSVLDATTITVFPGLQFSLAFQLFDSLNRTYSVSGGGGNGVTLVLDVFVQDALTGELAQITSQLSSSESVGTGAVVAPTGNDAAVLLGSRFVPSVADQGIVTFPLLEVFAPPNADSASLSSIAPMVGGGGGVTPGASRVIVRARSDRASMSPLSIDLPVLSCPDGYVLFDVSAATSSSGGPVLSCLLRPSFLLGDVLKVRLNGPLVLLSCFVAIIGAWTFLILVEQIITARGRGRAYRRWLGLSVLAFGFSGVWCMSVIGVTSVEVFNAVTGATEGFALSPLFVFLSLAVLLVVPYAGLRLVFTDADFSVAQREYVKGLGKVNKYRARTEHAPAWQQAQHQPDEDDAEYDASVYETSINKNSLLQQEREVAVAGDEHEHEHVAASTQLDDSRHARRTTASGTVTVHLDSAPARVQAYPSNSPAFGAFRSPADPKRASGSTTLHVGRASPSPERGSLNAAGLHKLDNASEAEQSPLSGGEDVVSPSAAAAANVPTVIAADAGVSLHIHTEQSVDLPGQPQNDPLSPPLRTPATGLLSPPLDVSSPSASNGTVPRLTPSQRQINQSSPQHRAVELTTPSGSVANRPRYHEPEVSVSHRTSSQHHGRVSANGANGSKGSANKEFSVSSAHHARDLESGSHSKSASHDGGASGKNDDKEQARGVKFSFLLRKALSLRIFAGVMVLFSGLLCGLLLMLASVQLEVDEAFAQWDLGAVIGSAIGGGVLFYPSMLLYFFLFTRVRMVACLPLVCSMLLVLYVSLSGLKWRYGKGVPSTNLRLDSSLMALLAFAISLVSCIVLIGINVVSLRLSRHQLSQVLKGMTVDMAKAQHQKQNLALHISELKTWMALAIRGRLVPADKPSSVIHAPVRKQGASAKGPPLSSWLDLGVSVGLSGLSGESGAASERRDAEAAMLLGSASHAQFDSRPAAVQSSMQRLQQLELLSAGDVSGAADMSGLPRITLEQVLQHPACVSFFLTHAARSHSEDSLLCFLSIAQYRQCTDEASRRAVASQIALEHLQTGAQYEVNMSSSMVAHLQHALRTHATLERGLFDQMAAELITLMQTNVWQSFVGTKAYWTCALILLATKQAQQRKKRLQKQQAEEIREMQ